MKKRILAVLLCFCLLVGLLPTATFAAGTDTGKAIQLGASPIEGRQASSVYFGNYQQSDTTGNTKEPVKWQVLANESNKLLLLADQNLDVQPYNTSQTSITWEDSTIRSWLNGYGASENSDGTDHSADSFINAAFSNGEQGAIAETYIYNATQSDGSSKPNPDYRDVLGGNNTDDKIFLLSIEEATNSRYFPKGDFNRMSINTAYVASRNTSMSGAGAEDYWWLRSPGNSENYATCVTDDGYIRYDGYLVDTFFVAVRPAFNLDLNAVLFMSATVGGKADAAVDSSLTAIGNYDGNEWKLTLQDGSRSFTATAATTAIRAGQSLSINYSGAQTGDNEYVSAMLVQGDMVLYYGRIAQNSPSGTASVTIPSSLAVGNYTLKVFSEQYNGDNKTDYASDFVDIPFTVTLDAEPEKPTDPDESTDPDEPATPGQTADGDTGALIGAAVVIGGGAAALAYHYREALPIWKLAGVVVLADETAGAALPAANAAVALYQNGQLVQTLTTDAGGLFTARLPKGIYEAVVTWEKDGAAYTARASVTAEYVLPGAEPQRIVLDAPLAK